MSTAIVRQVRAEDGLSALPLVIPLARCPGCGVAAPHIFQVYVDGKPWNRADGGEPRQFGLYKCSSCACGLVVESRRVAPGSKTFNLHMSPSAWEVSDAAPPQVRRFLRQAFDTLGSPDASIVMAAAAVDAILKDKGLSEGSLYSRIGKAVEIGLLTEAMSRWAHLVRLEANGSRHADLGEDPPIVDDARRSLKFAEGLVEIIYAIPAMIPEEVAPKETDPPLP